MWHGCTQGSHGIEIMDDMNHEENGYCGSAEPSRKCRLLFCVQGLMRERLGHPGCTCRVVLGRRSPFAGVGPLFCVQRLTLVSWDTQLAVYEKDYLRGTWWFCIRSYRSHAWHG